MTDKEIEYRNREKVPVASTDIKTGSVLGVKNISYKMIGNDISFVYKGDLSGLIAQSNIQEGEMITVEMVSP